ncbi:hypothetical protein PR048_025278 [Dryococelus australis]|uniref:Uncharacterized protein n=1 Tax=Dryococelus australis TaxID=614101 RepID=A0ABQ9GQW9_9NEOP|nr:hypothetical protein PR048_025278 [Dryococelus australis]
MRKNYDVTLLTGGGSTYVNRTGTMPGRVAKHNGVRSTAGTVAALWLAVFREDEANNMTSRQATVPSRTDAYNLKAPTNFDTDSVFITLIVRNIPISHLLELAKRNGANQVQFPAGSLPGFLHVGILPGDVAGWQLFSLISRFPRPFIPALLHIHITSHSSAVKTKSLSALPSGLDD